MRYSSKQIRHGQRKLSAVKNQFSTDFRTKMFDNFEADETSSLMNMFAKERFLMLNLRSLLTWAYFKMASLEPSLILLKRRASTVQQTEVIVEGKPTKTCWRSVTNYAWFSSHFKSRSQDKKSHYRSLRLFAHLYYNHTFPKNSGAFVERVEKSSLSSRL